jgi:hypothetical protein
MAGYIGTKASVVSSGAERKKVFDITTTTTSLTGCSYTPNQVHVFHNGVRLVDGTDYTATDGSTVTLTTAAQNGDEVVVISYATFQTSDTVSASAGGTFSGDITINGSLSVDGGTIKLDGDYPVGNFNTALGDTALDSIIDGSGNVAVGHAAVTALTSGTLNTGVGYIALDANTTGSANTALGAASLGANTTASNNTAVGYQAAYNTTTGGNLVATGYQALYSNTTGNDNNAFGWQALYANTTGSNNTSLGFRSLYSNTDASNNTAVGYQAGYSNTTATHNTFIGRGSGYSTTTGGDNVALGSSALYTNAEGTSNTSIGYSSMYYNTSGTNNVALGKDALQNNTTASNNTAIGAAAGFDNATGERCTFIGNGAGENSTVSDNTFVGQNSGSAITSGDANTILGRFSGNEGGLDIRTSSNHIVISDGDGNPRLWFNASGNIFAPALGSASTANNDVRYSTANGALYYQTSSARYKENIADLEFDTSNLYNLRPVSFDDKTTGERCYGLIAEETFEQIPELVVTREIDGEAVPDSIPYSMLSVAILNEMKKLKAELEDAKARITALEAN